MHSEKKPIIDPNPVLQEYYGGYESRIGYRLVLGGTRHHGYYASSSSFPLPVGPALRAMENRMFMSLDLPPGAHVLDAGCGVGHVALYMARRGNLRVRAIDVVEHHVEKARKNVEAAGLQDMVSVEHMDYHHLETIEDGSMDGVYTMETLVHSTDPANVLREFLRILKPNGVLVLHEYEHEVLTSHPQYILDAAELINKHTSMPANDLFDKGMVCKLVEGAGFENVHLEDLTKNITPMMRLFFYLAIIPYLIIKLFRLEATFINTVGGVEMYLGRDLWRYSQVTARKPAVST